MTVIGLTGYTLCGLTDLSPIARFCGPVSPHAGDRTYAYALGQVVVKALNVVDCTGCPVGSQDRGMIYVGGFS